MIQDLFTALRIRPLGPNTIIILIYDTDVVKVDVLEENIKFLKKQKNIKSVYCIPQIKNLENELGYSCNIKYVLEITHSKSMKDFKGDFANCKNLGNRLRKCEFSLEKLWSRQPTGVFAVFGNDSSKIKIFNKK